ncbi:hypothetical protein BDQ12DRAFT_659987 [Crucibulum laeve]|uniref:Lactonase, 7-bladed beta-propeller-domain-containing protein n=1 Tax=Crucibulum laeve TaxID=68775 RepID=A0A5C3LFD2_9AGAR|nr:hypothetical protein BDQ12DRAFT_659987 [Crucibulum laeve]
MDPTLNYIPPSALAPNLTSSSSSKVHHILSGSFRSLSLFLLAFTPPPSSSSPSNSIHQVNGTLKLIQTVHGHGPHQYLATNPARDRVYTTSWALPPRLASWTVQKGLNSEWRVDLLDQVDITATSSYITLPPPYTHLYSVGGPTGEVHCVSRAQGFVDGGPGFLDVAGGSPIGSGPDTTLTGGFGKKIQEILFVPEDELERADKMHVALRYSSHGIELSAIEYAFVPVLGTKLIKMYVWEADGVLMWMSSNRSPREGIKDGPRHVKVHPNGRVLYCVMEHSNYVDAYQITPPTLTYIALRSLIPPYLYASSSSTSPPPSPPSKPTHAPIPPASFPSPSPDKPSRDELTHSYRGDTLLLIPSSSSPAPSTLFVTTRGAKEDVRGWIGVFPLDGEGMFADADVDEEGEEEEGKKRRKPVYWQTPTSGGKANAIDLLPKSPSSLSSSSSASGSDSEKGVYILLTDDSDAAAVGGGGGGVRVLEWDGWGSASLHDGGEQLEIRVVAEWPLPGDRTGQQEGEEEKMMGGSHAIWLD